MDDIVIETIWSNPKQDVHFLDWCSVSLQLRNTSETTVRIEEVECLFDTEDGNTFSPHSTKPQELKPKQRSPEPISIEFEASLSLIAGTNSYKIRVHYRHNHNSRILEHDPFKYFILYPRGVNDKFFFISHRDPEDSDLARRLIGYLRKLGYDGYIAEDDPNPGIELWDEKIPPKVKSCFAIIVLWTSSALKEPANLIREIDLGQSLGKRIVILKEDGIALPDSFSKTREHFTVTNPIPTSSLIGLVKSLERMDANGCFFESSASF